MWLILCIAFACVAFAIGHDRDRANAPIVAFLGGLSVLMLVMHFGL